MVKFNQIRLIHCRTEPFCFPHHSLDNIIRTLRDSVDRNPSYYSSDMNCSLNVSKVDIILFDVSHFYIINLILQHTVSIVSIRSKQRAYDTDSTLVKKQIKIYKDAPITSNCISTTSIIRMQRVWTITLSDSKELFVRCFHKSCIIDRFWSLHRSMR